MIDLQAIFKDKKLDKGKLVAEGFAPCEEYYVKEYPLMQGQFTAKIAVGGDGNVDYNVYDLSTDEEYVLARVKDATGAFVGEVQAACNEILCQIADKCFYTERYGGQTRRVLQYIKEKYEAEPEFLWSAYPDFAALRTHGKKQWFAVVMKVPKTKFGLKSEEPIEIINLKNDPEEVNGFIGGGRAYPAYHMNKRSWFSVFLDGSLPDGEIFSMIDQSYCIVNS